MNTNKLFAIEFFIAIGINSWGAIKQGDAPWPPTILASCIALAVLSLASGINDRLAVLLGAGFLMASIMSIAQQQAGGTSTTGAAGAAQKWSGVFGAVPPSGTYDILSLQSGKNAGTTPSQGGAQNGQS